VASAFERFTGYPPLHGTLILHVDGIDVAFEIWAREPEFRVEAPIGGEIVPWIVNEDGSNLFEPHIHAPMLWEIDPRNIVMTCDHHRAIGSDMVLGRPVWGIACNTDTEQVEYWIDDATGLVLGRSSSESSWEFTSLDLDPLFRSGLFEFDASSEAD
jgi:hypothetical protein